MRGLALTALMTISALAVAPKLGAQTPEEGGLQARVWLDRGDEPVLRRGETVRIYYRTTESAYAAIFRIDTDGRITMIFPQSPAADPRLTGGVDYRLIFPNSPIWRVDEDPGAGYFFMVASPEPLDFSAFPYGPEYGWDLSAVGELVYEDPYVAMDDYVAALIPNWQDVPYALDFITYNVGDTYTYPRFLCYDCHDARPYASWNPYSIPCTSYRVVIYDDPYFYPYYRYSGTAVVVARPVVTLPRYAVAERAPGDSFRPLIRSRPAPPRRITAEFKESPESAVPTTTPRSATPVRQPAPRPTLQRRTTPSSQLPVRTPPSTTRGGASAAPDTRGTPDATIVRPARPSAPSTSTAPRTRPSQGVSPTPRSGASAGARPSTGRPTTRPSTPSGPSTRPSTQSRPSRPSAQPRPARGSTPTTRPAVPSRPSTRPSTRSRPTTRPATPSRPSTRPSTSGRPSAGRSRPTARPATPSRPPARSSAPARPPARSSAPARPPARSSAPSRPPGRSSAPSRPPRSTRR